MAITPELGIKLLYIFGITNITFMLLTLFSCRCRGFGRWSEKILSKKLYKKFYRSHCYFWWGFIISVIVHTILAYTYIGNPF